MEAPEVVAAQIRPVLEQAPVMFSLLFGSVARGEASPSSDVDVAVRYEPDLSAAQRFRLTLELGRQLERVLQRQVDVVDLDEVPQRFAGRILTERVVVTGLDRVERVRHETRVLQQYRDFEEHARRQDRRLLEAMARGDR